VTASRQRTSRASSSRAAACACALLALLVAPGAWAVCLSVAEIEPANAPMLASGDPGDGLGSTGLGEGGDDGIGGTGLRGGTDGSDGIGGTGVDTGTDGIGGTGLVDATDGIGGTGLEPDADGIGGTGLRASAEGIGGTGLTGSGDDEADLLGLPGMSDESLAHVRATGDVIDLGLLAPESQLARIVAVDSACVAGAGLTLHPQARVEEGLEALDAAALRAGQIVWIEATPAPGGAVATRVALRPIVEGPVAAVDLAAGRIEVMGEVIELAPDAVVESEADRRGIGLHAIGLGDTIVVHGVRGSEGRIRASYVGLRARSPFARIHGIVAPDPAGSPGQSLRVGAVRVLTPPGGVAPVGHWVEVLGRWDAGSKALVDARVVGLAAAHAVEEGSIPKESRSGSRLHLGQTVPVSTR